MDFKLQSVSKQEYLEEQLTFRKDLSATIQSLEPDVVARVIADELDDEKARQLAKALEEEMRLEKPAGFKLPNPLKVDHELFDLLK